MPKQILWSEYLGRDDLKATSDDAFVAIEAEAGVHLPEGLKQLMREHGGQKPINLIPRYPNGKTMTIPCLYHGYAEDKQHGSYSPLDSMDILREDGFEGVLLFADNGNVFLCLDYSEGSIPVVVMLLREFGSDDPDHKHKLADNFDEFLAKYTVPPEQAPA